MPFRYLYLKCHTLFFTGVKDLEVIVESSATVLLQPTHTYNSTAASTGRRPFAAARTLQIIMATRSAWHSTQPHTSIATAMYWERLCYWGGGVISFKPPMKGCSTSGTRTVPSSCWKFSRMATISRGTAHAVALSVCTYCVGDRFGGFCVALAPFCSAGGGKGLLPKHQVSVTGERSLSQR